MPENQTAPSPDVQHLVDEGYTVRVDGPYLIVENVPYCPSAGVIERAALISPYRVENGVPQLDANHTVWFTGSVPHTADGVSLENALIADKGEQVIAGLQVRCRLSNKPDPIGDFFDNFYNKLIHYIRKLSSHARQIDPSVSASSTGSFAARLEKSVFHYPNPAVARSGLDAYEAKLKLQKVAIVGLGGTGSYILDALSKTPVEVIHLYDHDVVKPQNAFRMPSALTHEEAHQAVPKTDLLAGKYSAMRVGVISHPLKITPENVGELAGFNFVFIAVDHGPSRGTVANELVRLQIPFIDVGIGVEKVDETTQLVSRARVTLVTPETADLVKSLPVADDIAEAVYNNIQLVELNALNAMLALVRYKQFLGFYADEMKPGVVKYVSSWSKLNRYPDADAA
jgi:molybdopterin/thiamine biosynthesis adenylyltransferase